MANKGNIDRLINALPADLRYPLQSAFYDVLDNFRWGTSPKSENGRWFRFTSTSAATANTEFTVAHGLNAAPTQLIQLLDLSLVNSQLIPLSVSRAADSQRIYLKSPSTSAVFTLLAEV
jgi:hypothetical protein